MTINMMRSSGSTSSNAKRRCLSCREDYGATDDGTCKECYEEASETEEELKRDIEELKAKGRFLKVVARPPTPHFPRLLRCRPRFPSTSPTPTPSPSPLTRLFWPEDKAAKKEHLLNKAQADVARKEAATAAKEADRCEIWVIHEVPNRLI